jgi:hypothetical protein
MQSLLANIDSTSSASDFARTVSVLDAVIWISHAVKELLPETVTKCFEKAGFSMGEVTASVENEDDQQDLHNCTNEAAFSNCNAEDYINIDNFTMIKLFTVNATLVLFYFISLYQALHVSTTLSHHQVLQILVYIIKL